MKKILVFLLSCICLSVLFSCKIDDDDYEKISELKATLNITTDNPLEAMNRGTYVEDIAVLGKLKNVSQINFIGDSIVAGGLGGYFISASPYDITGNLSKMLDVDVINYGVSGTELSEANSSGDAVANRIADIDYKENDITVVACGINDCGFGASLENFMMAWSVCYSNWLANRKEGSRLVIATILHANNLLIYTTGFYYEPNYSYSGNYSAISRNFAATCDQDLVKLADIEKAVEEGELPDARIAADDCEYFGNNGLHPNYTGYYRLAKWYAEFLLSNYENE